MMNNLTKIKERFDYHIAKRDVLISDKESREIKIVSLKDNLEIYIKARYVLGEVIRITQENFTSKIESLVTMAVRSVYDNKNYKFKLSLERKRNKMECRAYVDDNGEELNLEEDMGGGILDVVSFALRVVLWSFEKPRSRNVFILDEPMKWTGELITKAGYMMKEISERLNIQMLVVTHDEALIEIGDKVWRVVNDGVESIVTCIKGEESKIRKLRR